jgi:DNA-binding IclR family transcriptional regulator
MKPKANALSSTEKALKILLAFTPFNQEMGTIELSTKLAIHKSTVSRLLHLLTAQGFLQQNPDTKRYLLGRAAARIGEAVLKSLNGSITGVAQPFLHALCEEMGESIALEVLSGNEVYLAHHVEGQRHIRFSFTLGEQVPLHVAAGAKAILAHCDPAFVDHCLARPLSRFTPHTVTSRRKFAAVLEEVRRTGVAFDRGERYADAHAVAAPIFNHGGAPVAAVVMAGPAFRMTPACMAQAIPALRRTAAEISQRLFF